MCEFFAKVSFLAESKLAELTVIYTLEFYQRTASSELPGGKSGSHDNKKT